MIELPDEVKEIPGESLERIRKAILETKLEGESLTQDRVRSRARVDMRKVGPVVRAFKAGKMPPIADPWSDDPPSGMERIQSKRPRPKRSESSRSKSKTGDMTANDLGEDVVALADKIRAAKTDDDRAECAHEVARLVTLSALSPSQAREIVGPLNSARNSADKARKTSPPKEDPRNLLLCSAEAMQAARAIDFLIDDDRRARVLSFVGAQLEVDMAENPNVDSGGAAGAA